MNEKQRISNALLEKLQSTYRHFPDRSTSLENESIVNENLQDFLDAYGSDCTLQPGEILFMQNDLADGLYLIESGVMVVLQDSLDCPRVLTFRKPHHVVGEIALLENIERTASVIAITETKLKHLSKDRFQDLLSLIPGFGIELLRLLSTRLREVKPAEYSDGLYDHLTGALSRQAFDMRLLDEIHRAQRYDYLFSLVFLDIDHFKKVNDMYGHLRGDEVLIEFSKRIMATLRTTDLLFRYGGDEFVLILQGIDNRRGPTLVRHLMTKMASPIPGDPPISIGFSAGMSYFPADGTTSEALIEIADKRVYQAKQNGRGQVVSQ